jgi:hypothetical protein
MGGDNVNCPSFLLGGKKTGSQRGGLAGPPFFLLRISSVLGRPRRAIQIGPQNLSRDPGRRLDGDDPMRRDLLPEQHGLFGYAELGAERLGTANGLSGELQSMKKLAHW